MENFKQKSIKKKVKITHNPTIQRNIANFFLYIFLSVCKHVHIEITLSKVIFQKQLILINWAPESKT